MRGAGKYTAAALALIAVGAALTTGALALTNSRADQPPPPPAAAVTDVAKGPPPPSRNQFIDITGRFFVVPWDDRELSLEQKVANPSYDPAWEKFAQCAAQGGLDAKLDNSQKFSQVDLDRLIGQLNREYPNAEANKHIPAKAAGKVSGHAGAFLACAEEWLTKTPQEMYELTGVANKWWPEVSTDLGSATDGPASTPAP